MTSTQNTGDAADYTNADLSEEAGEDAFLKSFGVEPDAEDTDAPKKKRKPSEEGTTTKDDAAEDEGAEDDSTDESPEDEADSDKDEAADEEAEDDKSDKKSYVDSEDTFVRVKVGDEEREVSVKDLKRLYGQEASLTRKSQEVSDQRRVADEGIAKNVAALNIMNEKAKARYAPYATIDWVGLQKNPDVTAADINALSAEAKAAYEDVSFYEKDLTTLMTTISDKQKADHKVQAKECVSALETPSTADKPNPLHIEGWNDKVYDELRGFARELGAPEASVNSMVDPVAFKILHMALQFKRSSSKVLTVKTKKSPTKIVKSSASISSSKPTASATDRTKALANLKRSGSEEDAVNAFMAGMSDKD